MSDAVEVLARALYRQAATKPWHKWDEATDSSRASFMDGARALLAEITPLLVADAVKAEREKTKADLFKPMQDAMDVLSKASKWGYSAPLSFCRAFGSVTAAHLRRVERNAAIRARGGEG